jgi:hypothetical protein
MEIQQAIIGAFRENGRRIVKATVRITFEDESKSPATFERIVEFAELRDPGGDEFVAQYLLAEVEKESRWGKYWLSLPDVSRVHRPVKQTFRLEDLASSVYEDRINTRAMWVEIGHTLLRIKVLLSKSRALHEVMQLKMEGSEAENVVWHVHLDKMDNFDLSMILLGKVSELTARLIFERLGASLILNLDRSKPNWERDVTWSRIRQGFADRATNPNVAALSNSEYQEVQEILNGFLSIENGKRLLDYEHKFVHRITPSVDIPGFYTHLESRVETSITDDKTGQKGWTKSIGSIRSSAEYSFLDLYEDAVQTLRHYVVLLDRLDAIPRFGPEAVVAAGT